MAESNNRPDLRNGAGGAEVVRRGGSTRTTGEAQRTGAAERARREPDDTVPDAARSGRAVVAEVARDAVEAARQATETGAEMLRQGGQAGAEAARRTGDAAGQGSAVATEAGRDLTRSLWAGSEAMRRMVPGLGTPPGGMTDLPQALAGLMGEMMRTNVKVGQELFRLVNPVAIIEMQQRMVRSYLDALVAGQNALLGAARRTTEDMQRQAGAARDRNG